MYAEQIKLLFLIVGITLISGLGDSQGLSRQQGHGKTTRLFGLAS